ncbi:MAG: C45 family autoproteolytic acyltransferase/hydrolase [Chloroflexota bacterium]
MTDSTTIRNVTFTHAVLEGTAYEIGKMQAEGIRDVPEALKFFTTPPPDRAPFTPQQAKSAVRFFEQHCPGLNEEIHGFADGLSVSPEQIAYYAWSYQGDGRCSQIAALPAVTTNGHLLVGRNYEWNHQESDHRLVTTRIRGRAAHIGFSEMLFGRDDGINEHGLCVTMSSGAPMAPTEPGGCTFWAVIRTVLERCQNVDEAIELIQSIPISFNLNLMLADRSGQAALMEIASSHRGIRRIGPATPEKTLFATNHFSLPEMMPYDLGRMWVSVVRAQAIQRRLEAANGQIAPDTLRSLLSDRIPAGLCAHHYSEWFGTLWSQIFDVTAGTVDVCFGAPTHNAWHTFDLHGPTGFTPYPVQLPDASADPSFWRKLAPGAEA